MSDAALPMDRSGISVIVPTLNEARLIGQTLRSVLEQAPADLELIVVDGGSTDETVAQVAALADRRIRLLRSAPGRARQMNAGARAATGYRLLFLHGDTRLLPGSLDGLVRALERPGTVAARLRLRFDRSHPLLRFYSWCTSLPVPLFHYGDQGLFVRRGTFGRLGGFPDIPFLEDVQVLRRLRGLGRVAVAEGGVVTSARRFERRGIVRQQLLNGLLLTGAHLGVPMAVLKRFYDDTDR